MAIWHALVAVVIHATWLVVGHRTGAAPSRVDAWRVQPLSLYPTIYSTSIAALLVTMYGAPFLAVFGVVQAVRARKAEMVVCAVVVVSMLLLLWFDPVGAVTWYVD